MNYVNIGFSNVISKEKIVGVLSPNLSSTKQLVSKSKEKDLVIDVTTNRKIKSIIVMDSGHIFLCALSTDTIMSRLNQD